MTRPLLTQPGSSELSDARGYVVCTAQHLASHEARCLEPPTRRVLGMPSLRVPPNKADRARGRVLVDLLRFVRVLSRGRLSVTLAAEELGVTRRTVYRYLHALEAVGLRASSSREGREVHWRLTRSMLLNWMRET